MVEWLEVEGKEQRQQESKGEGEPIKEAKEGTNSSTAQGSYKSVNDGSGCKGYDGSKESSHVRQGLVEPRRSSRPKITNSRMKDFYWQKDYDGIDFADEGPDKVVATTTTSSGDAQGRIVIIVVGVSCIGEEGRNRCLILDETSGGD
ncbi:hypothetical protein DEO72_LG10g1421 [Vigna unguiculata]|uniref:Uncharacterized protein n=1 Tax=Vigna unguiculata TaxID=3917 RepID=A0A4D6NDI2_VIGUN|nr:hypothetical protein DEO72_LG10g1421 [Vigna unguiculata]